MERYDDPIVLKTEFTNRPYFKGRYYPNIPLSESDVYVITTVGDRLDSLAYSYYKDATLWWVIAMANNNITKGALYPEPGTQLRIPTDLNYILDLYNQFNQAR
jgi:nucleoid-associated protein YgaU